MIHSRRRRPRTRWLVTALCVLLLPGLGFGQPARRASGAGWAEVDYSALVDLRRPTHSGESIGAILRRLGGRPLPPVGERPADRLDHTLMDPLLEPYAFVLPDTLDTFLGPPEPPMLEVGPLWQPGEVQPAWAELLRARRYLVQSDGQGRLRVFLPWTGGAALDRHGTPLVHSGTAAARAWSSAWPVLRHVWAAEQRRWAGPEPAPGVIVPLAVDVHVYRHLPERLTFQLGLNAHHETVDRTERQPSRPALDLQGLQDFLDRGLRLEGARLEPDGSLRLFGSESEGRATLLGNPLALSDLAVAYRAVFHGGLAEPYMSLDRGLSPQTSIVNYGGRLRDTRLGWVSLLCDIRFKTFSLGLGLFEPDDLRERVRERLGDFQTHLERFAAHPLASQVQSQQTRLWFYPDEVELTVAPQGDLLAMRRVRMTAASERVVDETLTPARGEEPPWTRSTVQAINRHYDVLAELFPELGDLDRSVRWLALFTWLRQAAAGGLTVPDLDTLLALELPSTPTPRSVPQLLTFNALPPSGVTGPVDVLDRVPVAEALERLNPSPLLPARRRLARAVAALDRSTPQHAALLDRVEGADLSRLDESTLDLLAYQAERLRMHGTVLTTLGAPDRRALAERQQREGALRVFSIGIGGIDLGMGQAMRRARGSSRKLGWGAQVEAAGSGRARPAPTTSPAAPVRSASAESSSAADSTTLLPRTALPDHGLRFSSVHSDHWIHLQARGGQDGNTSSMHTVWGADGPGMQSRHLNLNPDGRAGTIERYEQGRFLRFRMVSMARGMRAELVDDQPEKQDSESPPEQAGAGAGGGAQSAPLPAGLATLEVLDPVTPDSDEGVTGADFPFPAGSAGHELRDVTLRLRGTAAGQPKQLFNDYPRRVLQRLVLGRDAVPPSDRSIPGLDPLPETFGPVRALMVLMRPEQLAPPWSGPAEPRPGEEDPLRLAAALSRWWGHAESGGRPAGVVATDADRSPERWRDAPAPGKKALLLLPQEAFPAPFESLRHELVSAWGGQVAPALRRKKSPEVVVLVSAEAPDLFARRLRALASHPLMGGKLLAAWCLSGPVRPDLPASLLKESRLAGVGVAEGSVVGLRRAPEQLKAFGDGLLTARAAGRRVDELPGPFLWFY